MEPPCATCHLSFKYSTYDMLLLQAAVCITAFNIDCLSWRWLTVPLGWWVEQHIHTTCEYPWSASSVCEKLPQQHTATMKLQRLCSRRDVRKDVCVFLATVGGMEGEWFRAAGERRNSDRRVDRKMPSQQHRVTKTGKLLYQNNGKTPRMPRGTP